jgi:hypothetical protein
VTIDEAAKKIAVTVPYGTDVGNLTPTVTVSTGAVVAPLSGMPQNFTNPVPYIVTAEDGSFVTYTVTVTVIFTDTSDIEDYLATAPAPVSLPVALNLASEWTNLLAKIQAAGKYVKLDLSACTISGTEFDPGAANTGEQYIVSLVLPNAAESIAAGTYSNSTFRYFMSLTEVSGTGITGVGNDTFHNCTALTSVTLPEATDIGNDAFRDCATLTSVSLPEATDIGDYVFYKCTALTSVTLPAATDIGNHVFFDCTALTSVSLPEATDIGEYVFYNCTALTSVTLPATPPTLMGSGGVFRDTSGGSSTGITIHVPSAAAVTAYNADGWVDASAGTNTAKYGFGHNTISIVTP